MARMLSRRACLQGLAATAALLSRPHAGAQSARMRFDPWVAAFRARAQARGVSERTYDRVMTGLKPDTRVFALPAAQPEFREEVWQYLNRRVSDWRMIEGRSQLTTHGALLARIEQEF